MEQGTVDVPEVAAGDVSRHVDVGQGAVDVPVMPEGGDVTRRVNVEQETGDVPQMDVLKKSIPTEIAVVETIKRVLSDTQWTGSVANLNPSDISATFTNMNRTMDGAVPAMARHEVHPPQGYDYSELTETLQQLKARLDEPIVAETYATGKGGTMTAAALVEKMRSNAKRKKYD